ncbi:MAG: hypothetical protein R6T92_11185 [Desulfosalsimonadaceae bacterium]
MNTQRRQKETGDGPPSPAPLFIRWLKLVFASVLIAGGIYLAPNLERLPWIGQRIVVLRESGINVGAWYYDDVEQYFEAEQYIREKRGLDYPDRHTVTDK